MKYSTKQPQFNCLDKGTDVVPKKQKKTVEGGTKDTQRLFYGVLAVFKTNKSGAAAPTSETYWPGERDNLKSSR